MIESDKFLMRGAMFGKKTLAPRTSYFLVLLCDQVQADGGGQALGQ